MYIAKEWRVVAENVGDYCYSRAQRGLDNFDQCMRDAEKGSEDLGMVVILIIAGIAASIYFYNRGKSDQSS